MAQDRRIFPVPTPSGQGRACCGAAPFLRQSHHALFAIDRGERGNTTQSHSWWSTRMEKRPSCGLRFSQNVQIAEDLNARDDGGQQLQVVSGGGCTACRPLGSAPGPCPVRTPRGYRKRVGAPPAPQGSSPAPPRGGVDILLKDRLPERRSPARWSGVQSSAASCTPLAAVAAVDGHENVGCCR